jgi:hypothetical protein
LEVLILHDFKSFEPEVLILGDFKSLFPEVLILVDFKCRRMSEMQKIEIFLEVLILGELRREKCRNGRFLAGEIEWRGRGRDMKTLREEAVRMCFPRVTQKFIMPDSHMSNIIYELFEYSHRGRASCGGLGGRPDGTRASASGIGAEEIIPRGELPWDQGRRRAGRAIARPT